jgi:hypothetical protein
LITDLMPNARQCMVEDEKLSGYLLNIDHEHGRAKAIFFLAFGFTESDLSTFRAALQQHPISNHVSKKVRNEFGQKYLVTCILQTPDGRNPCINTVWIEEDGGAPRLVTAYPNNKHSRC